MKFILSQYEGNFAMHCKTREDALTFLDFLAAHNMSWCTGNSYLSATHHENYGNQTAYAFNAGQYGDVGYYESLGYTVLNFEDFEWDDINIAEEDLKMQDGFLSRFTVH